MQHKHETEQRLLPHSVEVTRNARGEYQWSIKRYFEDGAEIVTVDTIHGIDSELRRQFLPEPPDLTAKLEQSIRAVGSSRGKAEAPF